MAVASVQGFVGGTNASPTVALHPQGLTDRGGGCPSLAIAHTLTADSAECFKIASPSSAAIQVLPSANVKAGKRFTMIVEGATETNYVALTGYAGGGEIEHIGGDGVVEVVALQDAPTALAHWEVVNVAEQTTLTKTAAFSGGASFSVVVACARGLAWGIVKWADILSTAAGNSGSISIEGVPSRFVASAGFWYAVGGSDNGSYQLASALVNTNGILSFYKSVNGTFSGGAGVTGILRGSVSF